MIPKCWSTSEFSVTESRVEGTNFKLLSAPLSHSAISLTSQEMWDKNNWKCQIPRILYFLDIYDNLSTAHTIRQEGQPLCFLGQAENGQVNDKFLDSLHSIIFLSLHFILECSLAPTNLRNMSWTTQLHKVWWGPECVNFFCHILLTE